MSPVGHSLIGLAFASVALSPSQTRKWKFGLLVSFVALASLPDWPIPNWGHDQYRVSHSVYVNLALIGFVLLLWGAVPYFRSRVTLRCFMLGAGAWLSHLLLDSFYNHNLGIAIYWPFSEGRLNFSMPWFDTLDLTQSAVSPHNLSVYAIEFVAYFPVLIIVVAIQVVIRKWFMGSRKEDA